MKSSIIKTVPTFSSKIQAVQASSNHTFSRHFHDVFGVGFIQDGGHQSSSGRGQVEAFAGNIITVNPGEVHCGAPIGNESRKWRMLYFEPEYLMSCLNLNREAFAQVEFHNPVLNSRKLALKFQHLFDLSTHQSTRDKSMIWQETLLETFMPIIRSKTEETPTRAIKKAAELLNDELTKDHSLLEISNQVQLSQFQLIRGFRRTFGITPHAYLIQRRLNRARQLIVEGVSLSNAAYDSGFFDQSHMSRHFKAAYGMTPGAFISKRV